jgi:hypothetical protein
VSTRLTGWPSQEADTASAFFDQVRSIKPAESGEFNHGTTKLIVHIPKTNSFDFAVICHEL